MSKHCACKDPYHEHEINHKIEEITDIYINKPINIFTENDNGQDIPTDKAMILSIQHYLYTLKVKDVLYEYTKKCQNIQTVSKYLRNIIEPTKDIKLLIKNIKKLISNAPSCAHDIIVWRGIDIRLDVKMGDIIDHPTFIWASVHKRNAMKYLEDTRDCYSESGIIVTNSHPSQSSTLFKILVPAKTSCIDISNSFDFNVYDCQSEILLNKGYKLLITNVQDITEKILQVNVILLDRKYL